MDVDIYAHTDIEKRIVKGKVLLDSERYCMTFVQNLPRGPRSVEVGRTTDGRFVRRPDGVYTLTLHANPHDRYLKANLVAQIRNAADIILNDIKIQSSKTKQDA